jgi:hypothetical protein
MSRPLFGVCAPRDVKYVEYVEVPEVVEYEHEPEEVI